MISFSIYPTIVVATVRRELDDFCCFIKVYDQIQPASRVRSAGYFLKFTYLNFIKNLAGK